MRRVISRDGTVIAYERSGEGRPVILVGGAFADHSQLSELAGLLAAAGLHVVNYDRRGRGTSGDTQPYALAREIEDLEALIGTVGGEAAVFGGSSGAALALEAAAAGLAIDRLVVYEPPYVVDGSRPPVAPDIAAQLSALIASGRPGDAAALFMTEGAMVAPEAVAAMRAAPHWSAIEAVARTLVYDAIVMGPGNRLCPARLATISAPALVIDGGASPAWIRSAAQAVAGALSNATGVTLADQVHDVDQSTLAPVVASFLTPSPSQARRSSAGGVP